MIDENKKCWHCLDVQSVLECLGSSADGLSAAGAQEKLHTEGPNELIEQHQRKALKILIEQFTSTMEIILIVASVISIALGSVRDSVAILAIVVLFAVLGFVQDYRAEKAMAALKKLSVPFVRVRRNGSTREISAKELVRGDIIFLETGNIIPADCRLIETSNLKIQESALTGEPEPNEKTPQVLDNAETALGDRTNMAFMGTIVTIGRATAVVTETGMQTELGKIASILQSVGQQLTPLQKRLDYLGKVLAIIGFGISAIIIAFGIYRGESLAQLLLVGISVAVAVIPEGLPAVVTITLAIGSHRMLQRNTLIRKLPAVETLGSVTVICSDKTGTLTQNKMSVNCLNIAAERVDFQILDNQVVNLSDSLKQGCNFLVTAAALCNDAKLSKHQEQPLFIGDPTETALIAAAYQLNISQEVFEKDIPRIAEIPFDSNRKRMTTVHRINSGPWASEFPFLGNASCVSVTKGALDGLLEISDRVLLHNQIVSLTGEIKKEILVSNERLAEKGIRVIGVAFSIPKDFSDSSHTRNLEQNLIFVGSLGLVDPPRPEVRHSVEMCKKAGIRPIMITGDHPLTAKYIASELGILGHGQVLIGTELEKISTEDLQKRVNDISVYARVSPEHKLKIVEALQNNGEIVAMTGDGVNDAPALKKADIGVAMGITGTDVSKDASDVVLVDDNFASIVNAILEGRIIYDNIKKFVKFSVGGNIGKVIVMLLGPLLWTKLPLIPLQLLWLNLLTDGLLGLGLGMEKGEGDIMTRRPVNPKDSVFAHGGGLQVTVTGLLIGAVSLIAGGLYSSSEKWQTMIFASIAFAQVWQVLSIRSETDSLTRAGLLSNRTLISMVVLTILLQLSGIYVPFLQDYLKTQSLSFFDLFLSFAAGSLVFIVLESEKFIKKWFHPVRQ